MPNLFRYILPFLILLTSLKGEAQVYPVQSTLQITPPYSLTLADYVAPGSEKLALNIFLADVNRPELSVRLRLRIEGVGIRIETKAEYLPEPMMISGGVPLRLIGADLADYFDPRNLNFSGITQREYEQKAALPEGLYQFTFEVIEYNRGVKISNSATVMAWLILNDPPLINLPKDNDKIRIQSPQQVIFQWTPRHTGSPNAAFSTEYEFRLVEVWPSTRNPNDAILTSPAIFETTTAASTLIYGPAETPLEPGRRYAFRIKAKSIVGVDELNLFKNNGYSQVSTFVYGDACTLPTGIQAEVVSSSKIGFAWDTQDNHTGYNIKYRLANTPNAAWYTNTSALNDIEINSLQPATTYEYQVAAACGSYESEYSPVATVTTNEAQAITYSCGLPLNPFDLDPSQLIESLKTGDVIQAGDFDVKLTEVSGSNGIFTGKGVIEVPFFNKARLQASFSSISVNKELRMVAGSMNITGGGVEVIPAGVMDMMDELTEALALADSALNLVESNLPQPFDPYSFVADKEVKIPGTITSVTKGASGGVVVTASNGTEQTIPAGGTTAITDSNGNGYLIDSKGNIHPTTAAIASAAARREYNLNVNFAKASDTRFGFDAKKHDALLTTYEHVKDTYYASWKSIATGQTDNALALLEGTNVDKTKIHFEQSGVGLGTSDLGNISQSPSPNSQVLTIKGTTDGVQESVVALYTPSDTTKKEQVLGKLNVVTYNQIDKHVVIVPVNGNTFDKFGTVAILQDSLNKIYNQGIVNWTVELKPGITVEGISPFEDGGTGLLSNFTSHMKKVINAYKENTTPDTYYLFLVSNPQDPSTLGVMPRSKEYGFIFADKHSTLPEVARTIAHELGHGAFNLHHTFMEPNYTITKGTTDNLMDYPAGSKLYKYQWDKIRYPDIVVGVFESDEESKSITVNNIEQIKKYENSDGSYTFVSVAGKPISIKGNLSMISFIASEDIWRISEGHLPMGTLSKFTVNDTTYTAIKSSNSKEFLGYSTNGKKFYDDRISHQKKYQNVLIGIPCFKNLEFTFKVFPTSYFIKNGHLKEVKEVNHGEGDQEEMFFLSQYMEDIDKATAVFGQFDQEFKSEELFFIAQQASEAKDLCGSDALYVYNIAYLIHKKPELMLCVSDVKSDVSFVVQNQLRLQHEMELSQQNQSVSTAVERNPIVIAEESRKYSEAYKEKFKEKYLEVLNTSFTNYSSILSSHPSGGLSDKDINIIVEFFSVENATGRMCLLRSIPYKVRIEIIKKYKTWTLSDNKEELIVDLIETISDQDIPTFIADLKTDYTFFWGLYGDTHMSEHDRLIFAITSQIMMAAQPDQTLTSWNKLSSDIPSIGPKLLEWNESSSSVYVDIGKDYVLDLGDGKNTTVSFFYSRPQGTTNVEFGSQYYLDGKNRRSFYKGNPFEYVAIEFIADFQLPKISGEKIRKGQRVVVPAIWAYWLLDKQESIENFAKIRVILNGGALIISALTMEPGPLLAVEVLANSIDIVVAINEDDIKSSGTDLQKQFLTAWNDGYALYGAAFLSKGVFSLSVSSFMKAAQSLKNSPAKLVEFTNAMKAMSLSVGKGFQNFKNANVLQSMFLSAYMQARILTNSVTIEKTAELIIAQENFVVSKFITTAGTKEVSIAKMITEGEELVPVLTDVRWYKEEYGKIEEVLQELTDFTYLSDKGAKAKGALEIISVSGAQSYVRLKSLLALSKEQEAFVVGLKKFFSEQESLQLFNYYESKFSTLKVKEYGSNLLIDGRAELLTLISKYSNRSDLIKNTSIIDGWSLLNQYPILRNTEYSVNNANIIVQSKLYTNLDDVQKAINSSKSVDDLLEVLADAKTADEFAAALRDIKQIDFPVAPLKDYTLQPANVNIEQKDFYNKVMEDLSKAIADRKNPTLTQTQKKSLSEQIGVLSAHKEMLEQGYTRLEHQLNFGSNAKQGQFDCIYWNGDQANPKVFVIEAKGGDGILTSREIKFGELQGKRAQQGTIQYRDDIIANMKESGTNSGIEEAWKLIEQAIVKENLNYLLIRQELNSAGELTKLTIKEF